MSSPRLFHDAMRRVLAEPIFGARCLNEGVA